MATVARSWPVYTVLISAICDFALTTSIVPANPIVLVGTNAILKCQSQGGSAPTWSIEYLSHVKCSIGNNGMVTAGRCHRPSYSVQFVHEYLNGRTVPVSTLKIPDTTLSDAGIYICLFTNQYGQWMQDRATLSVLASALSGESNPRYVTSGQNLTHTCSVSFNSSSLLKITWTELSTGRVVSPPGGRITTDEARQLTHLESTMTVTVQPGDLVIRPYSCKVVSTASTESDTTLQQTHTWNSSVVTVSYCPKDVAIMATDTELLTGSRLTCQSVAHPPAAYRWLTVGGSGTVSGAGNSTLTVASLATSGVIEFRCTAVNFLHGENERPCFASASVTVCRGNGYDTEDEMQNQPASSHTSTSRQRAGRRQPSNKFCL